MRIKSRLYLFIKRKCCLIFRESHTCVHRLWGAFNETNTRIKSVFRFMLVSDAVIDPVFTARLTLPSETDRERAQLPSANGGIKTRSIWNQLIGEGDTRRYLIYCEVGSRVQDLDRSGIVGGKTAPVNKSLTCPPFWLCTKIRPRTNPEVDSARLR